MVYGELAGIRIDFINMPLRESASPNTPPQGPGLMAARLRQYGAEPTIIDLNAYRIQDEDAARRDLANGRHLTLEEAESLIEEHFNAHGEPDIVAFSGMITTLRWQKNIAKVVRELVPDAFMVSGGGLATEIKEGLFDWIPELDAVAHSEGDDVILLLARDIKSVKARGSIQRNLSRLVGSRYYFGNCGKESRPKFMYAGDRPANLDDLPFAAWDLLHVDVRNNPILEWYIQTPVWGGTKANNSSSTPFLMERSLTTVSSRGCPYACGFCFRGGQGERNYGMRGPQNLRKEAEWLKRTYNLDFLGFPDDNFAVTPKRIKELPPVFEGLDLRWGTHTRLDEADERVFDMAAAGCVYIGFGAESASERVLESMGKGGFILRPRGYKENQLVEINGYRLPVTMVRGIQNSIQAGIHGNCTWIMGYPGERLIDLKTSVAFILWQIEQVTKGKAPGSPEYWNAYESVNRRMFVATAYPGTEMCRSPKVKAALQSQFNVTFQQKAGCKEEPAVDEHLQKYVLELDDATKVLHNDKGEPLYYGDMSLDKFLEARSYVDNGTPEKILDMTE